MDAVRTSRNILQISLDILSKTSINGIGAAAEALSKAIDRIQFQANADGWKALEERLQSLAFCASEDTDMEEELRDRFKRELEDIHRDIEAAKKQGRVAQFFNSKDDSSFLTKHNTNLTDLVCDINVDICTKTSRRTSDLRKDFDKFKDELIAVAKGNAHEERLIQRFTNELGTVDVSRFSKDKKYDSL
ncbi:hypothetical protein B0H12DRAFT_1239647 [Mycena haematopus]|nr:hypothetical protein B0H12DRAFT_1239647 [Mycena haematopus]